MIQKTSSLAFLVKSIQTHLFFKGCGRTEMLWNIGAAFGNENGDGFVSSSLHAPIFVPDRTRDWKADIDQGES